MIKKYKSSRICSICEIIIYQANRTKVIYSKCLLPSSVKPRHVHIKDYNRSNKSKLLVKDAKLLEANLQHAWVILKDSREISASLLDLAQKANRFMTENYVNNYEKATKSLLHEQNKIITMISKRMLTYY